ncbi:hypothetical protein BG46_15825 [Brucella anthropi]|nr:hypothetical protein BG46_15825 [Brucella anthropi]
MSRMTRTISYCKSDYVTFVNETVTGTRSEITRRALCKSWVLSRAVNVIGDDGFPDETFGDWGSVKCHDEDQYLRACMSED